jgi:hypothetical protein
MQWLRWLVAGLSPERPRFELSSVHVGFVMDKVSLGQVSLQVIQLSPVNIIPAWIHTHIYHLGDEQ